MSSAFKRMHVSTFQIPLLTRAQGRKWLKPKMKTPATPPQEQQEVCVHVRPRATLKRFVLPCRSTSKPPPLKHLLRMLFVSLFFRNTHYLSINFPSVFSIYLTLTCTNAQTHALRSSKTRKRAIKHHVATVTRPSEERHSAVMIHATICDCRPLPHHNPLWHRCLISTGTDGFINNSTLLASASLSLIPSYTVETVIRHSVPWINQL